MNEIISYLLGEISSFDHAILWAIHSHVHTRFLDMIMPFITALGDGGVFWIALSLVLLIPKKTRRTGAAMAVAMLLGLIIGNGIIKNVVMRTRPFDISAAIVPREKLLIAAPTDYSFPSGHTLASFEAATALFKDHSVYGFLAYVLAILIAFSRLYLQVHYPSDVLGGAILGFLLGLLGSSIVKTIGDKMDARKLQKEEEKVLAEEGEGSSK